ncbi:MAG: endolysin [Rhodopirellula sp.]|nr:endolysin [Rhodopirellula sp.]
MLLRLQGFRLTAVALAVPMALLPATPAFAAGGTAEAVSESENVELAQLRFPRLRMPSIPRMPRVFAITPERRALLNTIRYAEGTWKEGADIGYRVMFGGSLMKTLDRHPDRVNYTSGYASAAAGAYQFMPATWRIAVRALDLVGFGPHAQDQAALYLIQKRGAMNLADGGVLTPQLAAKLAPEWASFPTMRGYSYYGQPVVKYGRLKRFYEANLQRLRQMHPPVALIEEPQVIDQGPEPCNDDSLECMLAKVSEGL